MVKGYHCTKQNPKDIFDPESFFYKKVNPDTILILGKLKSKSVSKVREKCKKIN